MCGPPPNESISRCKVPRKERNCGKGRYFFPDCIRICPRGREFAMDNLQILFDNCFKCGRPLTENMEEYKDWYSINNCGEAFPICKKCYKKGD